MMAKWIFDFIVSFMLPIVASYFHSNAPGALVSTQVKTTSFVLDTKGTSIFQERVRESRTDILDPRGGKITFWFLQDGTMKFSSNADAEFKQLAFSMVKTTIGLKILKLMYASNIRIVIEFNKVDVPLTSDGHYIGAQTIPIVSTKVDKKGMQKGLPYISSAKIVIYEAGINDMLRKNEGKVLIDGKTINLRLFSIPDIIASFAIHEGTHVLYREFSGALNPKATKYEIERKPYENQLQHYRELLKKQK